MASQRELVKLFRTIARQHRTHLPPVLSSALNTEMKKNWLISFKEFQKIQQTQEKQVFQEDFVSKWNEYLKKMTDRDPSKEFRQYIKVALDPEGKETLSPGVLPQRFGASLSPEQLQKLKPVLDEISLQRTEDLKEFMRKNEDEFVKDLTQKQIEETKAELFKQAKEVPQGIKENPDFLQYLTEKASSAPFLKYTLPLFRVKETRVPPIQDPILTPDQLKERAKQIEELRKLSPEQRSQRLEKAQTITFDQTTIKNNERLLFCNKTEAEKAQIEEHLKGLGPDKRAREIQNLLNSELLPLPILHENEKRIEAMSKMTPEERKKAEENLEIEALHEAESKILERNHENFWMIINDLMKLQDPTGEQRAQIENLPEDEKAELLIQMKEYYLPSAWNNYVISQENDPEYVKAQGDSLQWKAWLENNSNEKRLEEENQKLLKQLLLKKTTPEAKH